VANWQTAIGEGAAGGSAKQAQWLYNLEERLQLGPRDQVAWLVFKGSVFVFVPPVA
jgi:hypothetical protein